MRSYVLIPLLAMAACSGGYVSNSGTDIAQSDTGGDTAGAGTGVTDGTTSTGGTGTGSVTTGGATGAGGPFNMATHPAAMQLSAKQSVAAAPKLRVITFNGDAYASQLETFASAMAQSVYWTGIASQYGMGALNVLSPIRATKTWSTSTTAGSLIGGQPSDIEQYLVAQMDGASPAWGPPDPTLVTVLYMPSGIVVSPDGGATPDACKADILAWHTAMRLPQSQVVVPYVVVPYCGSLSNLDVLDSRTLVSSAEIVAATTNPTLQGWSQTDTNHAYWSMAYDGIDVASACELQLFGTTNLGIIPSDLPFYVQRIWSNGAAAQNSVPCLPAQPNEIFFNATPVVSGNVSISVAANDALPVSTTTQGVTVGAGQSVTVPLDLWSSAAMNNWTISAQEMGSSDLTLTLDRTAGNNGTVAHLAVKMANAPSQAQHLVRITSTLGNFVNNDYLVVHN